jgi:putative acetyltransferase
MRPIPSIRNESPEDIADVRAVVHAAFGRAADAELVDSLRESGALALSAVAVFAGRVVGHVGFSPLTVGGRHPALALAPVSVAPDLQRQGIGSTLIRWSLEECLHLGHRLVVVLGEPAYYHRFGFTPASDFGIECPFPVPPGAFMVLELLPGAARNCHGAVSYRPEFELV